MNAERLLEVYEQISEAPDALARLRRFVLDLAVRGKLVEQDAGDESAAELLKRIKVEKDRIVREGKFKKSEGTFARDQEAFAFPVPASWHWCYLDDVTAIARGGSPRPIKAYLTNEKNGIPWIKIGDSTRGSIHINSTAERIKPEGLSKSRLVIPGDLLLSNSMSFGFPYITNIEGCIHDGWLVIRTPEKLISKFFLHTLFLSEHAKRSFAEAASGAVVQNLNADKVRQLSVPLPPLAEQHRIVAKVDELMALCDRLEEARKTREEVRDKLTAASLARLTTPDTTAEDFPNHAAFALEALPALTTRPDQIKALRQTILKLAVRGKLVEQDPADEPAMQLLARVEAQRDEYLSSNYPTPAEANTQRKKQSQQSIPAKLPELPTGWSWATLQQCALMVIDCKNKTAPYSPQGIRLIRTTNVRDGLMNANDQKFVSEAVYEDWSLRGKPAPGDILITREAPMGEVCIIPEGEQICLGQRMMLARLVPETIDPRFMLYSLRDPDLMERVQDKPLGMTVQHLRVGGVETLLVPLPPVAEQHRIVAKVDALMVLCDQLEAALTAAEITRTRLLEALLHEALEPATEALKAAE
ncbi:restriction endonuclease subunit S [Breoghania sp.]|uniref:restriction endonuclease subunit S n=1 Tax=Breoghania sp. TaxID=2065378 RepID=UPI002AAAB971|nr:restriction endonuclease subunit S [Breoghania sp.]